MDLIRELKDVRFELHMRGYDCDAVDAFLAKMRAEVAELQTQRETAQHRVEALENQVSSGESDTEGTLRRTLVLAQRLADETVADAKQTAESMIGSATAEAAQTKERAQNEADELLASANEAAAAARETGEHELQRAREDAARISEEAAAHAARERAVATDEAARLLAEAEAAGAERVQVLERAAQEEVARMREPIREEISQLEQTRAKLVGDIEALEQHLTEQRTRVRTAVEALRAGMSGSIEDLERVATDEAAMSAAPRPPLSEAVSSDVDAAPAVEIVDSVDEIAAPAPTVEQLAEQAAAGAREAADAERAAEESEEDDPYVLLVEDDGSAEAELIETETDVLDDSDEGWTDNYVPDAAMVGAVEAEVIDAELVEPEAGMEPGLATEPIPVIEVDDDDFDQERDPDDGVVVDLDAEPSALFGTDVSEGTDVLDADAVEVEPVVGSSGDPDDDRTFLGRFADAIGDLPISPQN